MNDENPQQQPNDGGQKKKVHLRVTGPLSCTAFEFETPKGDTLVVTRAGGLFSHEDAEELETAAARQGVQLTRTRKN